MSEAKFKPSASASVGLSQGPPIPNANLSTVFIDQKAASTISGMSPSWHERARWQGEGPPYVKIGRKVRYDRAKYIAWFMARERLSTSDADSAV
ncbi:hypothetical protein BH10CYA1_BH10CYA1_55900 [soil metagenome]